MERRERRQLGQRGTHLRCDPNGLREARAAMHHAMRDALDRGARGTPRRLSARARDSATIRSIAASARGPSDVRSIVRWSQT